MTYDLLRTKNDDDTEVLYELRRVELSYMKEFGENEALNCELVFEITSQSSAVDIGILVLGGDIEPAYCSVELWSETASDGGSCTLKEHARGAGS